MLFFFKPSVIHLDCFTHNSQVYNLFPIVKGSECYPDWWKSLPTHPFNYTGMTAPTNMKACAGMIDYHTNSLCIRLWADLAVRLDGKNYGIAHRMANDGPTSEHPAYQFGNYLDPTHRHLKLHSPWKFKCKTDIDWVFVGNSWNRNINDGMTILNGVINFKYQHETNINLIFKISNLLEEKIYEAKTPLVNLFPMSEKRVVVHNHLISEQEHKNLYSANGMSFSSSYFKSKKQLKENESAPKCPFHF